MNMLIGSTGWDSFLQLIVVLVMFVFVLGITVITTKWIGGYQKTQMNNKNLKILEILKMGNNKYIALVEVGRVYLVVGIGKDNIHTIAKLTEEELPDVISGEEIKNTEMKEGFQEILEKIKRKKGNE